MNQSVQQDQLETLIEKTVVFQCDTSSNSADRKLMLYYNPVSCEINLSRSLNEYILRQQNHLNNCQFFYYDHNSKYFTYIGTFPFEKDIYVDKQLINEEPLVVRYRQVSSEPVYPISPNNDFLIKPQDNGMKKRQRQRTIKEALQKVAQWRDLHERTACTLEVASKIVGIPKKTLDDYFLQIKLGQNYQFDFQFHENDKIGVLRKFVKLNHNKKQPYVLKILEKYSEQNFLKAGETKPSTDK